jgi:hypothetical protein
MSDFSRDELNAWLTDNCGRGLPFGEATDLPSALHGLAYVLRQIECSKTYKVNIGQCVSATTAIRWVLDYFAAQALRNKTATGKRSGKRQKKGRQPRGLTSL